MKRNSKVIYVVILAFLSMQIVGYSQINKPDSIYAHEIHKNIVFDGKLNDESWINAISITNFRQREMEEGAAPTEKTKVAILYDKNNLYIGFWGFDSNPEKLVSKEMKRDFKWGGEDNFEFILGTYNDSRNGFLFVINPNGARADALVGNEGNEFIKDWNGVWDVKTTINNKGWFAEIIIPFSTLSFQKKSIQNWQINFERNIRRKNEQLLWQGYLRQFEIENISHAGTLVGLNGIKSNTNIEVKPYITTGIELDDINNLEKIIKTGGEANINITPTIKLNLTVNTDFAQVEADDAKVNLSRFNLYYKEKRQFFLEGSNYFQFKTSHRNYVFYSRRIGLENGAKIPVYGGVRLFGKIGKNNIGFMSLQTGKVKADFTDDSLDIKSTNFSVLRYRRDILNKSSAGFIITSKIREDGRKNIVYGGDFNYTTSKFLGDKNFAFGLSLAKSFTDGMDNAKSLTYNSYIAYFNDDVKAIGSITGVQENYNAEMGFSRRTQYRSYFTTLEFNPRFKAVDFVRNFTFIPYEFVTYVDDKTGDLQTLWYEFTPLGIVLQSGDEIAFRYQKTYENIDESFEIFQDINVPRGQYWNNGYEIEISSFKGRRITGDFQINYEGFYDGKRTSTQWGMNINVNKHMNFNFNWNRNYIEFSKEKFVVHELGGKIVYALNPKLNTSLFGQWNNEDKEIILNYRVNWIPKIGSNFYFVINQLLDHETGRYKLKKTTLLVKFVWRFTA